MKKAASGWVGAKSLEAISLRGRDHDCALLENAFTACVKTKHNWAKRGFTVHTTFVVRRLTVGKVARDFDAILVLLLLVD